MNPYTLGDVARICKVSRARLRYWERTELLEVAERGDPKRGYGFRDLVTVKSLLELLERGVPLRRIRRSVEAVRRRLPELERPLDSLRMWAEGSEKVVVRHQGRLIEPDGQMVLDFSPGETADAVVGPFTPQDPSAAKAQALRVAEAWFERGCLLDSDRATYADAVEAYERAIDAFSAFSDAYCNLGSVHFKQGRRSPARACFERAIEIEPDHLEANLNLAILEEESGNEERALRHYEVALQAAPLCADTHVSVALLYEKLGAGSRARDHWRRYLQLDPRGAWSDIARQRTER